MSDSIQQLSHDGQDSLRLLQFERALLESLFPADWFSQARPGHAAYHRWSLINEMLAQRGMIDGVAGAQDVMLQLCHALLDAKLLGALAGGDLQRRTIGDLSGYGDETVQKSIRTRVVNAQQFGDVMAELAFAGWHVDEGNHVTPSQDNGQADLTIRIPSIQLPLVVDCKHIETTSERRVKDVIQKTNQQIKAAGRPCYGIAALDLTERVPARAVTSDDLPGDVLKVVEELRGSIVGPRNRSVSAVVLIWDDLVVTQRPPKTWYRLRRRCHIVRHAEPREALPEEVRVFHGSEVRQSILWNVPQPGPNFFHVTDRARTLSGELSLDLQHATQAVVDRDEVYVIAEIENGRLSLFLKTSIPGRHPVLACALEQAPHYELLFALPIPRSLLQGRSDPLSVLETIAASFGVRLRLEGEEAALFHSRDIATPQPPMPIASPQDEPLFPFWMMGQKLVQGQAVNRVFLAFCLAVGRYRRWLDLTRE